LPIEAKMQEFHAKTQVLVDAFTLF
jgi:hypothetical protein